MTAIDKKEFILTKTDGSLMTVIFCHKNEKGEFVHGLTTEEVLSMIICRQEEFSNFEDVENFDHQAIIHLKQALMFIKQSAKKRKVFKK